MSKIKEVSSFNGSAWGTAVPLGVNDSNVDITSSTTNAADSTATLAGLDDINVTVASGDTDASAWTKFNKFRQRVKNVFGNYVTTSVLNNYMANVIGISGTSTPTIDGSEQTVLSAINSLNDKASSVSMWQQDLLNNPTWVTFNPSAKSYLSLTRGVYTILMAQRIISDSTIWYMTGLGILTALIAITSKPVSTETTWNLGTDGPVQLFRFNYVSGQGFNRRLPSSETMLLAPPVINNIFDIPNALITVLISQSTDTFDVRGGSYPVQYNETNHCLTTLSQIRGLFVDSNNKAYIRIYAIFPLRNVSINV